ncbi:MAG: DUF1015 domain-containing protein [Spirochaetaceae bacterium]|nr:MAG: DUF1015 domain-containing protein [Spirochaetaceae bacterium]
MTTQDQPAKLGLRFSTILLPAKGIDLERWAVIACDQFTSDQEYWDEVERFVGDAPSTLRMILPEIYLEQRDQVEETRRITETMERYLRENVFREIPDSAIYVKRSLPDGTERRGLVVAVDLESYDYHPETSALVRASEETIPSRLPARADIRKAAPIETPHVLVLYNDPDSTVMDTFDRHLGTLEQVYKTPLMMGGGSIAGWQVPVDHPCTGEFLAALEALRRETLLFATGDGNHSLAAAKTVWEERKAAGTTATDPYRYCLVELVNVFDPGLPFHPIHRVCRGDAEALLASIMEETGARLERKERDAFLRDFRGDGPGSREIGFYGPAGAGVLALPEGAALSVEVVDNALARMEKAGVAGDIDYVHGLEEVCHAADRLKGVAWIVPEFDRDQLFPTVAGRGTLPRKAFSLGQARDKRYYLECRAL